MENYLLDIVWRYHRQAKSQVDTKHKAVLDTKKSNQIMQILS